MKRLMGVMYICTKYKEAPRPLTPAATTAFCQTSGTAFEDVRQIAVSTSRAAKQNGLCQLFDKGNKGRTVVGDYRKLQRSDRPYMLSLRAHPLPRLTSRYKCPCKLVSAAADHLKKQEAIKIGHAGMAAFWTRPRTGTCKILLGSSARGKLPSSWLTRRPTPCSTCQARRE